MGLNTPPADESDAEPEAVDVEAEHTVTDPEHRWHALSTVVAFPVALHLPALVVLAAFGVVDLTAVPQAYFVADTVGWLGVLAYIFGEQTIKAGREALGK